MSTLGVSDWELRSSEHIIISNSQLLKRRHLLIGITRVRNEALTLQDTLDYVGKFTDAIAVYDDASTDDSGIILRNHPKVALIIQNNSKEEGIQHQSGAEMRHRGVLLNAVRNQLDCEWLYCFNTAERIIGDVRDFISNLLPDECNGIRVRLFDAYLTPEDQGPLVRGRQLLNLCRHFGTERKDILMLWRNRPHVQYRGLDAREPSGVDYVLTNFTCQNYSELVSVEPWEVAYASHREFCPSLAVDQKHQEQKKSYHGKLGFHKPLLPWGPLLFSQAIVPSQLANNTRNMRKAAHSTSLSILLATNHLSGWTGSETLLLTVVEYLHQHGYELTIYCRDIDLEWAKKQIASDIRIVSDLSVIRDELFSLAHVQHNSCLVDIRAEFPNLPILFSSLGVLPFLEQPPPFDCGVTHYLAISEEVQNNLVTRGIEKEKINIIHNLVNEHRFYPQREIRHRLEKILVLSYKIDDAKKLMLYKAAASIGASIRFSGGPGEKLTQNQLPDAINDADVVVSLGRGVIETMLCGRIPLIFDSHGGDGLVTPKNLDLLSRYNFSGRLNHYDYSISDLITELKKYQQNHGNSLREMALLRFGLEANMPHLIALYKTVSSTEVTNSSASQPYISFSSALAGEDLKQSTQHKIRASHLNREVYRIKRTISWKITIPLRVIWNLIQRHTNQKQR